MGRRRFLARCRARIARRGYHRMKPSSCTDGRKPATISCGSTTLRGTTGHFSDHGADFAAVLFPMSMQIHPDDSVRRTFLNELGSADLRYPDRRLADLFQRHDLPLLLMTSRLVEHARANDIYLTGFENTPPGEGHYNETGHLLIAEAMTAFLCERVSVPEPGPGQR